MKRASTTLASQTVARLSPSGGSDSAIQPSSSKKSRAAAPSASAGIKANPQNPLKRMLKVVKFHPRAPRPSAVLEMKLRRRGMYLSNIPECNEDREEERLASGEEFNLNVSPTSSDDGEFQMVHW
jgi:hypothetical protein